MTKLLQKGIDAIRTLSPDRQNMAGEVLLGLAGNKAHYHLTPQQIKDVKKAITEADKGKFASKEEMAAAWKGFGL